MNTLKLGLISAALGLAACASSPPPELDDAHTKFELVANSQAAQLDPTDVHVAQEQLAAADRAFIDHGDNAHTRDLAYAATRKAELADVRARTIAANKQQADAKSQLEQMKDANGKRTAAQLSATEAQLQSTGQALAISEQERAAAEKRSKQAAEDLARIASVKQEPRGMVITLSGGVLFASAKYDLLPQAQAKLSQVADVLTKQDRDSKILVQGYTDSQGSVSFNETLSQHRAESVRTYLVSHGIAADRVTAQGFGPASPVADNASAEGRADNRRVEIVVQPASGASERE